MDLTWGVYGIETPKTEYRFDPKRKWRFDYVWEAQKVAVEIEGGVWTGGRHIRGLGFLKDMEKYNRAGQLGFRIFRFTPQELKKGIAQAFIKEILK